MARRIKTNYPGVVYREVQRRGGKGTEKVFYIIFKKNGKVYEEKAGRQYADDMTAAKAAGIRAERIEGKRKSRKEIREEEEAKRQAEEAQKKAEADKWTISRLWETYKAQNPVKGIAQDESRYRKYLKPSLGEKEPGEILPLDIDRLRLKALKGKSPQTVKLTLALLLRIVNFGAKRQLCAPLPFSIDMPSVDNLVTEDLTAEELKRLLEALDKDENIQAANLMRLALFTGMRRGELFRLKWEDIDFERGFIRICRPKSGISKVIPLNPAARQVLENHQRTESSFVFPGRNGQQRTEIRRPVGRIRKAAGLPENFRPLHGLRHVYASMLASSGQVDMYTLQKLLTHGSSAMTQRYAHLRDEALQRAADVAGTLFDQLTGGSKEKAVGEDQDE